MVMIMHVLRSKVEFSTHALHANAREFKLCKVGLTSFEKWMFKTGDPWLVAY